eukprot:COSAG02_NODE_8052_length_2731_cov_3.361322_2_plen_399_part_01
MKRTAISAVKEGSQESNLVHAQASCEAAAKEKARAVLEAQKRAANYATEAQMTTSDKLAQTAMRAFEFYDDIVDDSENDDDNVDGSTNDSVIVAIDPVPRREAARSHTTTRATGRPSQSQHSEQIRGAMQLLNSAVPPVGTKVKVSYVTGYSEGIVAYVEGSKMWIAYPEMVDRASDHRSYWFKRNLQVLVKPGNPEIYRLPPTLLRRLAVSGGMAENGPSTAAYDSVVWHEPIDWAVHQQRHSVTIVDTAYEGTYYSRTEGDGSGDEDAEFEAEVLLDARRISGKKEYLVKWAGDSSICNSWEPADEMQRACPELVSAFEAKEPPFSSETDISALDLAGDVRTQGMSSYEMQRERNIQRNLEMLTKLGLRDVKSSFDNPCREGNQGARGKTSMLGSKR